VIVQCFYPKGDQPPAIVSRRGLTSGRSISRVLSDTASESRRSFLSANSHLSALAAYPRRVGRDERISRRLFGLAPTGVCRAASVTRKRGGLLPHHFTLTLMENHSGGLFFCGTDPSLSFYARRPEIIWRSALWSPDFPRYAIIGMSRPSDQPL
jgi:hypothetical protein